jgi:flagellar hook-basal body complex protein FliE
MDVLKTNQVHGDSVRMRKTHPLHMSGRGEKPLGPAGGPKFGDVLMDQMNRMNDAQNKSLEITQRMVTDPESVEPHDVTIALAEANMSLSIAKGVMDRVVRAYRDITNTR